MASKTLGWIDPTIDAMPGQVIAPVGAAKSWIAVPFQRRLEFHPDAVTGRTIAGVMTHLTHRLAGTGHTIMFFTEK